MVILWLNFMGWDSFFKVILWNFIVVSWDFMVILGEFMRFNGALWGLHQHKLGYGQCSLAV